MFERNFPWPALTNTNYFDLTWQFVIKNFKSSMWQDSDDMFICWYKLEGNKVFRWL